MYAEQSFPRDRCHPRNARARGRILVVDDDRSFGALMIAMLEARGHDAEWASGTANATAYLQWSPFDLVIVDLEMPDGNGLDFIRRARGSGLLGRAQAVVLTGSLAAAPDDIRLFHKEADLEAFIDQMTGIVTSRRRLGGPARRVRSAAGDMAPSKPLKIELVLYTSAASEKSQQAARTIRNVLERYDASQVRYTVCDLSSRPDGGESDAIVFTPTLVKRGPGPRTWVIGSLDEGVLIDLLDTSGVDRRRD